MVEGSLAIDDLVMANRHEFVIRYFDGVDQTVWIKPFTYWVDTNGLETAMYDLGPDAAHTEVNDLFNGFFYPMNTPTGGDRLPGRERRHRFAVLHHPPERQRVGQQRAYHG